MGRKKTLTLEGRRQLRRKATKKYKEKDPIAYEKKRNLYKKITRLKKKGLKEYSTQVQAIRDIIRTYHSLFKTLENG